MSRLVTTVILLGLSLVLLLLVILLRRALYRRFPTFFAYCALRAVFTVLRLVVKKYPTPYFMLYWTTEALFFLVSFVAMAKILKPFFDVSSMRYRRGRLILPGCMALVVLISLLPAIFSPINPTFPGHFASAIYSFVILMCVLEIALFILAGPLGYRYRLEWSQYESGILVGFGVLAIATLFADYVLLLRILHLRPTPGWEAMYRYSVDGALIPALIAWLVAFWRPEPPEKYEPPDVSRYPELAEVLQQRANILKDLMRRLGLKLAASARTR